MVVCKTICCEKDRPNGSEITRFGLGKGKEKIVSVHYIKAYGGAETWLPSFVTPIYIGEWSASRPDRFTPFESDLNFHSAGGCVDTRAGLDMPDERTFFLNAGGRARLSHLLSP